MSTPRELSYLFGRFELKITKTADNSHEYMWVEVASWEGGKITGLLRNEPRNVPELHAGQDVNISEADIFDYIRQYPDGTSDGNETGILIEKRGR